MKKGQQQIRCSSDVSIADRINSHLQVKSVFIPVLSSPIPTLLSLSIFSSSHGPLKLCLNGLTQNYLWFQTQALLPLKMKDPRDQQQGQVPEMVKSENDVAVLLPLAEDTGILLQGRTPRTKLAFLSLAGLLQSYLINMLCYSILPFRKRRSPSPGRRRRSPSPLRRRRSLSPPRRRYRHIYYVSVVVNFSINNWEFRNVLTLKCDSS